MGTDKFYIVAISGDVSARGIGDTADAILIAHYAKEEFFNK